MFFSCPYMVTLVLSITLAAEDVTALVSVNQQFKKIHQIVGYNEVFYFISLIFPWTKVAIVDGSRPCDCVCMHCDQPFRAFLLTLQFMLSVEQKFHHGGITRKHLSYNKIISVLTAYLLGDLSAYTHWYGAISVMTSQLCWCVWHLFFIYIPVKIRTVYLAMLFSIH